MVNLSGAGQRDAYEKIKQYCSLRLEGNLGENEIAEELGFRSPETMHIQLKNWGLSGPLVDSGMTEDAGEKRRKASSSGDMEELPAAEQTQRLFRADLKLLAHYADQISELKEHLQGELFVSSSWVGEEWEYYRRDEYTEERWQKLCEDFDVDTAQEEFRIPISPYLHHGAGPTPWEGLVCWIAVHALMNESIDSLIRAMVLSVLWRRIAKTPPSTIPGGVRRGGRAYLTSLGRTPRRRERFLRSPPSTLSFSRAMNGR